MWLWLRRIVVGLAVLLIAQWLFRIYIFFCPTPTPPLVAPLLRSRWRMRYRDPQYTLAPLRLRPGLRVLEVGPGNGVFTTTAAAQIRPAGQLICVELQKAMARQWRKYMGDAPPDNISPSIGDAMALPLADAGIDLAYLIAVLPMIRDRRRALTELWRVLRPGGILAVSEELLAPEYVPPAITERWCRQAGFILLEREIGFWCYMLTFRKSEGAGKHTTSR